MNKQIKIRDLQDLKKWQLDDKIFAFENGEKTKRYFVINSQPLNGFFQMENSYSRMRDALEKCRTGHFFVYDSLFNYIVVRGTPTFASCKEFVEIEDKSVVKKLFNVTVEDGFRVLIVTKDVEEEKSGFSEDMENLKYYEEYLGVRFPMMEKAIEVLHTKKYNVQEIKEHFDDIFSFYGLWGQDNNLYVPVSEYEAIKEIAEIVGYDKNIIKSRQLQEFLDWKTDYVIFDETVYTNMLAIEKVRRIFIDKGMNAFAHSICVHDYLEYLNEKRFLYSELEEYPDKRTSVQVNSYSIEETIAGGLYHEVHHGSGTNFSYWKEVEDGKIWNLKLNIDKNVVAEHAKYAFQSAYSSIGKVTDVDAPTIILRDRRFYDVYTKWGIFSVEVEIFDL